MASTLTLDKKAHWDHIYDSKPIDTVSWYQSVPKTSLMLFNEYDVQDDAAILDVGGGQSLLSEHLLKMGFQDLTVLDISEAALKIAQKRMGSMSFDISWVRSNILDFNPERSYDIWHDRATFHFLLDPMDIERYVAIAAKALQPGGLLFLSTFSMNGPKQCSGMDVKHYSEALMQETFQEHFELIEAFQEDHFTPSGGIQNFQVGILERK